MSKTADIVTGLVATVLVIAVTILGFDVHSMSSQVASLHSQVSQDSTVINSQQDKLRGSHRDLITCADFQSLLTDMNDASIGANGGLISWGPNYSSIINLPAHCLNQ